MKITVNLDTQAVITQPSPLRFKGGCFNPVEIAFTRSSVSVPLPSEAVIELSIKPKKLDGDLLAYLNIFTPAAGNLYTGSLNCATAALLAALELAQIEVSAEVTWSFGGQKYRSVTFAGIVEPPVTDDEVVATPDPELYPTPGDVATKTELLAVVPKRVIVADDADLLALTTAEVRRGDKVMVTSSSAMYEVLDEFLLGLYTAFGSLKNGPMQFDGGKIQSDRSGNVTSHGISFTGTDTSVGFHLGYTPLPEERMTIGPSSLRGKVCSGTLAWFADEGGGGDYSYEKVRISDGGISLFNGASMSISGGDFGADHLNAGNDVRIGTAGTGGNLFINYWDGGDITIGCSNRAGLLDVWGDINTLGSDWNGGHIYPVYQNATFCLNGRTDEEYSGLNVRGGWPSYLHNIQEVGFFGISTPVTSQPGYIDDSASTSDIVAKFNQLLAVCRQLGLIAGHAVSSNGTVNTVTGGNGTASVALTSSPSQRITSTSFNGTVQERDMVYNVDTTAGSVADYVFTAKSSVSETVTITSGNHAVLANPDANGKSTFVGAGTSLITARGVTSGASVSKNVSVSASQSTTLKSFSAFATGSLAANAVSQIDSRLSGKSASTALALFTSQDHSAQTYVRNTSAWCSDVDTTCLSVWNSLGANQRAGTLVTRSHVIYSVHFPLRIGTTVRFVAMDNTVVNRTVAVVWEDPVSDIGVAWLGSALPTSIKHAKLLWSSWTSRLPSVSSTYNPRIPVLATNQSQQALVKDWNDSRYFITPTDAQRLAFSANIIGGDSGHPIFLVVNGELVLLSVWHYASSGPCLADYVSTLNNVIRQFEPGASPAQAISPPTGSFPQY